MPCKNLNYKGRYAFTITGFVTDHTTNPPGPLEPIAVVGHYQADGVFRNPSRRQNGRFHRGR